jgi:hypothetical protein
MKIAVYGASGHTAGFVVAELLRRGHTPIALGRDASKVAAALGDRAGNVEIRGARLDSADSLDRGLAGTAAVIHCAGPFLDTAAPLVEAALRARVHYVDVTAEQGSALSTFASFDTPARERGIVVVPAAGFYGGLGDLLATSAMGGWAQADRIDVAIALSGWRPTPGTRRTGQRNTAPRLTLSNGKLKQLEPSTPMLWEFPAPFGTQETIELPLTETVLIARHLRVRDVRNAINHAPLRDLRDPATPGPVAADERGRSSQTFAIEAVARNGDEQRSVAVRGRDIYAITAPIVVESVERIFRTPSKPAGAYALGQLVDAADFLRALVRMEELEFATAPEARTVTTR